MIVSVSYVVAALSMYSAALYLIYRLRLHLTTSSFLLVFLLIVHGPAYLVYMLSRGGGIDYLREDCSRGKLRVRGRIVECVDRIDVSLYYPRH